MQNPDNQIVTDKVWHELAFGLENLGVPTEKIRRRVGEMASYFGIQGWFRSNTDELSGGQKQLLNLASVMVMQPKILILDEPTGQLDPIAAADFIATLQKLNRELGLTIILAEHRLEEVFPIADKVLMMDEGRVLLYDTPRNIGKRLGEIQVDHPMLSGLPSAVRIFNAFDAADECPLTVRDGRNFLETHFKAADEVADDPEYKHSGSAAVEMKNVWFRYERNLPDVLRGVSMKVYKGEFFCILGGNGTGKTTTLNVISALNKPYRGKIFIDSNPIKSFKGNSLYRKKLAFLPQNPQTVFLKDNVKEDFEEILQALNVPKAEREIKIGDVAEKLGIAHLLDKHPYDLSGGEQQKCALAKMLMLEPEILLLDEPTKGMDAASKKNLSDILNLLLQNGLTIIMVTHDVEFAAENADRCALFFDGEILSADVPSRFFAENNFYTTAANRIARGLFPNAVTCEEVVSCCRKSEMIK
ncbi:MAG: energy-coupling factor ABC transporter ATP-binding protein [Ruminococcus sp.]|nr:energy-coupling factor ABC transporter ATP-binding protein [Ruminococcus sp.]